MRRQPQYLMATPLSSDSDFDIHFRPIAGQGPTAPILPVFGLESAETPLPVPPQAPAGLWPETLDPDLAKLPANELPTFDDLERQAAAAASGSRKPTKPGSVWLEGDVLMIACPDCHAPMAVRIWLMAADCWNCGISVELSEEQEREAQRLLAEREQQQRQKEAAAGAAARRAQPPAQAAPQSDPSPRRPPPPPPARPAAPSARPPVKSQSSALEESSPSAPASAATATMAPPPAAVGNRAAPAAAAARQSLAGRTPAAARPSRLQAQMRKKVKAGSTKVWLSERLKETPAWLLSMIIHLIMLTLLSLLTFEEEVEGPFITISSAVSREVKQGEAIVEINPADELNFELPITDKERETLTREALVKADQAARELQLGADDAAMQLAPVENVKQKLKSADVATRALVARDPRLRVEMVKQEGGTTLTEAAVSRGLRWLASKQKPDGRWVLDGSARSDAAATSLALLPFLGAGQTHLVGRYQPTVSSGLRWLVDHQTDDGDLSAGSGGNTRMYAHGQCAIVLCEAFAMTGDESLRGPAQKAINFIVKAQHPAGGWRYQPGQAGDTSVFGWQLMALQSARSANLAIRSPIGVDVMQNASRYLDSASKRDGAVYAYQPGAQPNPVMTAEALLCRMYLGWNKSDPSLLKGVDYLREHLPKHSEPNFYYWYYGTQVFHHVGGEPWEEWNLIMRDILVDAQDTSGNNAGSWAPKGPHTDQGGRLYVTSLAVCTLEVYYRHTPIFRQLELE